MKGLELTVVAAITATMLTSPAFVRAVHRNHEAAPSRNSPVAAGGDSPGYEEIRQNVER
jgi:hypothetical protein